MRLLVASEYSSFLVGGAEHSLRREVCNNLHVFDNVTVMSSYSEQYDMQCAKYEDIPRFEAYIYFKHRFKYLQKSFPILFTQLILLYNLRSFYGAILKADLIYTQNRWYPYVCLMARIANKFQHSVDVKVFIRDEKCISINKCYDTYYLCFMKKVKNLIEFPSRFIHRYLIFNALKSHKVIFNSKAMYNLAMKQGISINDYEIRYPPVETFDLDYLDREIYNSPLIYRILYEARESNALLVGNDIVKGIATFKALSREFRNFTFIIMNKSIKEPKIYDNIIELPWSTVHGLPYKLARVVIVPSLWNEAVGRVALESQQFRNIVLVSNKGGLPEAIENYDLGKVCNSISDYIAELQCIWN